MALASFRSQRLTEPILAKQIPDDTETTLRYQPHHHAEPCLWTEGARIVERRVAVEQNGGAPNGSARHPGLKCALVWVTLSE